jgi:hypothetical protein
MASSTIVSVRIEAGLVSLVRRAAQAKGVSVSKFVADAAIIAAKLHDPAAAGLRTTQLPVTPAVTSTPTCENCGNPPASCDCSDGGAFPVTYEVTP